jgi:hypothetical protein
MLVRTAPAWRKLLSALSLITIIPTDENCEPEQELFIPLTVWFVLSAAGLLAWIAFAVSVNLVFHSYS